MLRIRAASVSLYVLLACGPSVLGSLSGGFAQEAAGEQPADEAAIRSVVDRYEQTWNAHDLAAWGELFTENVDYVHRGGGWWRSNEDNVDGHRRIHERLAAQHQEMNLQLTVASITFLHPRIALVHVTSEWPGFDLPAASGDEVAGIMTMIVMEDGGAWRIRALQNTLVTRPDP